MLRVLPSAACNASVCAGSAVEGEGDRLRRPGISEMRRLREAGSCSFLGYSHVGVAGVRRISSLLLPAAVGVSLPGRGTGRIVVGDGKENSMALPRLFRLFLPPNGKRNTVGPKGGVVSGEGGAGDGDEAPLMLRAKEGAGLDPLAKSMEPCLCPLFWAFAAKRSN